MEQYKKEFIEFMVDSNVLKFGEFTLKSGRKIPIFHECRCFMIYWNDWSPLSPNCPGAASMFCSANAAEMSEGINLYCAITSGFNQIRME